MPKPTYKTTHRLIAARRGTTSITVAFGHGERLESSDGSSKRVFVKDGYRTAEVELWIDLDGLFRFMASDAVLSKSRVSRKVHGLVQMRAVNVTEVKS